MKKTLVLISLVLLFSCTAKKTLTKSDVSQKNDISTTTSTKTSDVANSATKVDENSVSGTETTINSVVYDTDKPIDVNTGKPPVKSETTKVIKKDNFKKIVSEAVFTTIKNDSTDIKVVDKSKIETETKVSETPKKSTFAYVYYILVIVIVLVVGFFIYAKFGSKTSLFRTK